MARAEIVPLTLAEARRYVAEHHRHNEPPMGHKFSIGLRRDGELVGVVIASRPVARGADDGQTLELIRLTTEGDRNACSRLYGAACRAAFAMGYKRVITYTLGSEPGTSLRAAGFTEDAWLDARPAWQHTAGSRATVGFALSCPVTAPAARRVTFRGGRHWTRTSDLLHVKQVPVAA